MHVIRAALVVLALAVPVTAQSPVVNVSVIQGRFTATIIPTRERPYLAGDPYGGIPVRATDGSKLVLQVRVRAWPERDRTRVVVFAVENPGPADYSETPIASFLATPSDEDRLISLDDFGAAPVTVRVVYK